MNWNFYLADCLPGINLRLSVFCDASQMKDGEYTLENVSLTIDN